MKRLLLITTLFVCSNTVVYSMDKTNKEILAIAQQQSRLFTGLISKIRYNHVTDLIAVATLESGLKIYNPTQNKLSIVKSPERIFSIDWNQSDANKLACGSDKNLTILDINKEKNSFNLYKSKCLETIKSNVLIQDVKYIPSRSLLGTASNKAIELRDIRTNNIAQSYETEGYYNNCLAPSSDGNQLVAKLSKNNTLLKIWDLRSNKIMIQKVLPMFAKTICYNPKNNTNIAIGSSSSTKIFDTNKQYFISEIVGSKGNNDVRYNPSGKLVASVGETHASIYSTTANKIVKLKVDNLFTICKQSDHCSIDFNHRGNKFAIGLSNNFNNGIIKTYQLNEQ